MVVKRGLLLTYGTIGDMMVRREDAAQAAGSHNDATSSILAKGQLAKQFPRTTGRENLVRLAR